MHSINRLSRTNFSKKCMGGCLCDNWKSSFLIRLISNSQTFSRRVTARWSRGWAKNQVSTNQNSRKSWSLIARRTIWWYLFKRSRPYFSKTSRCIILKVYQSCFNIPCVKYIRKFCFYFCAYYLAIFSHMISTVGIYFQNYPSTKHLYGDFGPVFAGNFSLLSGILPYWER